MARFSIRTWDIDAIVTLDHEQRRTRTSAASAAYRMAYDVLKAFGKLDTEAAHKVMAQMALWDDIMSVGSQRACVISNTGRSVTLERLA